jgi:SAM-dependent methyltransferase
MTYRKPPESRGKDCLSIYYPESRFGGFTDVDGTIAFYLRVHSLLTPSSVVLEVGCGRGAYGEHPVPLKKDLRVFKGKCAQVIGIDVDERARDNPYLDAFHRIDGEHWPIEDQSIDLCICDSVLEHIARPEGFFAECRRTIKPGGYLCIRTPNLFNYISLISRIVPNHLHARVLDRVLSNGKNEEDIFPAVYRCNTRRRLRRMLDASGFDHCVYAYEAEPYHLGFSRWAYFLGVLHQRFAPKAFRSTLFAFAQKRQT